MTTLRNLAHLFGTRGFAQPNLLTLDQRQLEDLLTEATPQDKASFIEYLFYEMAAPVLATCHIIRQVVMELFAELRMNLVKEDLGPTGFDQFMSLKNCFTVLPFGNDYIIQRAELDKAQMIVGKTVDCNAVNIYAYNKFCKELTLMEVISTGQGSLMLIPQGHWDVRTDGPSYTKQWVDTRHEGNKIHGYGFKARQDTKTLADNKEALQLSRLVFAKGGKGAGARGY